jgi:CubicO group peptidase (beta-lactamase class C family)
MLQPIHIPTALLALLAAAAPARAQALEDLVPALERRIPAAMAEAHVPGLSMVLIRERRIAWRGCFGVRRAGEEAPVDPETIFEAASMSKPLYCYAVLELVERGRFDLDRPLDAYLPAPYLPADPRAARITGRMVLTHRTGLPNWRKGGWRSDHPLTLVHEPGSRFIYSGEGFLYLQRAVEALTGEGLAPWIERRLLAPLGMKRSSYVWRAAFAANHAGGHDAQGRFKTGRRYYERANAAYSLYTTPSDYARFLIELMRPERDAEHSLGAAMVRAMTTLQVSPEEGRERTRRSLGFLLAARGGWVGHSGSNGTGFRCTSRFHMERGDGCVIMTNSASGVKVWQAVLRILDRREL